MNWFLSFGAKQGIVVDSILKMRTLPTAESGEETQCGAKGRRWRKHIRVCRLVLGLLVIVGFQEANAIDNEVRLVVLQRQVVWNTANLILVHRNGTNNTVRAGVSIYDDKPVLATETFHDAICWFASKSKFKDTVVSQMISFTLDEFPVIDCLWKGKDRSIVIPKLLVNEVIKDFYFQIDPLEETVYWKHSSSQGIWSTSLKSPERSLNLVHVNNTSVIGNPFFAIDPLEGLVFMHVSHDEQVKAIKLSNSETLEFPQNPQPNFRGIALDPIGRKVFVIRSSRFTNNELLYVTTYDNAVAGNWEKERVLAPWRADFSNPQFYKNNVYIYGAVYRNLVEKSITKWNEPLTPVVKKQSDIFSFSVFENKTPPGIANPCLRLNCSYMCLPEYKEDRTVRSHYGCRCPDRNALVGLNVCARLSVIYRINGTVYVQDYSNASAVSTECENPEKPRQTPDSSESSVCDIVKESSGEKSQVDFFGEGWTTAVENCIQFHSKRLNASATLHCLSSSRKLESFALDHLRAKLFWIESENEPHSAPLFHLRSSDVDPGSKEKLLDMPITGPVSSLALASDHGRIFWIRNESVLITSDYQGQDQTELAGLGDRQHRILRFAVGRLWWNEINLETNESSFAVYDMHRNSIERFDKRNDVRGIIDTLNIALTPAPLNPCEKCKCPFVCIPKNDTRICLCPDFTIPSANTTNPCIPISLLVVGKLKTGESVGARRFELKALTPAFNDSENPFEFTLKIRPKRITASFNGKIVCWLQNDTGDCKCLKRKGNSNQVWNVTEVNQNSMLLTLDEDGKNLFWNSGEPGSIFMTSLSKQATYEFTSFETPDISNDVTAIDTERRIFFWADDKNKLHYRALYTNQTDSIILPGSDGITSIALDTRGNILYCIQGNELRSISYQNLFQESNKSTELLYSSTAFFGSKSVKYFEEVVLSLAPDSTSRKISAFYTKERKLVTAKYTHTNSMFFVYGMKSQARKWPNSCENSECSHFCFLKSPLDSTTELECACPVNENMTGNRTCRENIPSVIPPSENTTIAPDDSTSADTHITPFDPSGDNHTVVACVLVSLLITTVIVWLLVWFRRRSRNTSLSINPNECNTSSAPVADDPTNDDKSPENSAAASNTLRLSLNYIIPTSELKIDKSKLLGEGQFGQVFQGIYQGRAVAVKTIKSAENPQMPNLLSEFLHEVQIVAKIGAHPHIVQFFGAEISDLVNKIVFVVLELSPLGSLLDFVRIHSGIPTMQAIVKSSSIRNLPLESFRHGVPIQQRLSWAEQIARGMCHLQDKNIIHGDLAARNVLVFDNAIVKLSDFGLSRNLYQYAMYEKQNLGPLPWRWMAIESLQLYQFSSKSDVWSYGVTLWEIFTSGFVPYPEQTWSLSFVEQLAEGKGLQKSRHTPTQVYENLMRPCWKVSPVERPDFHQLLSLFPQIRNELGISHQLEPSMHMPREYESETAL